jgi:gas vesicle protein
MKEHSVVRMARVMGWGLFLGGSAGFLLGMLMAPQEGTKLRRKLRYLLENLGTQVSDLADQVLNPEAESDARRTGDALVADARIRAQRIRQDIDALLGEVHQHGSSEGPTR